MGVLRRYDVQRCGSSTYGSTGQSLVEVKMEAFGNPFELLVETGSYGKVLYQVM